MKNRKIGFKLDFSLLQQTCEFRRSTAEIFRRRQRQFSVQRVWMQVKSLSDWSLDWIQSEVFGQEFDELMPRRSTNIAPLSRKIILNNSLSFEPYSNCLCLSLLAVITNTNNNNFSDNNLTKALNLLPLSCTLLDEGQTARLHNTLYITSLVLSHYPCDHGSP